MINPRPVLEIPRAVEQSIFIFEVFPNNVGTDNGRVVFVTEQYVDSRPVNYIETVSPPVINSH